MSDDAAYIQTLKQHKNSKQDKSRCFYVTKHDRRKIAKEGKGREREDGATKLILIVSQLQQVF